MPVSKYNKPKPKPKPPKMGVNPNNPRPSNPPKPHIPDKPAPKPPEPPKPPAPSKPRKPRKPMSPEQRKAQVEKIKAMMRKRVNEYKRVGPAGRENPNPKPRVPLKKRSSK